MNATGEKEKKKKLEGGEGNCHVSLPPPLSVCVLRGARVQSETITMAREGGTREGGGSRLSPFIWQFYTLSKERKEERGGWR